MIRNGQDSHRDWPDCIFIVSSLPQWTNLMELKFCFKLLPTFVATGGCGNTLGRELILLLFEEFNNLPSFSFPVDLLLCLLRFGQTNHFGAFSTSIRWNCNNHCLHFYSIIILFFISGRMMKYMEIGKIHTKHIVSANKIHATYCHSKHIPSTMISLTFATRHPSVLPARKMTIDIFKLPPP